MPIKSPPPIDVIVGIKLSAFIPGQSLTVLNYIFQMYCIPLDIYSNIVLSL